MRGILSITTTSKLASPRLRMSQGHLPGPTGRNLPQLGQAKIDFIMSGLRSLIHSTADRAFASG
jgi:hypothetical protein